jgi:hypothetical protein
MTASLGVIRGCRALSRKIYGSEEHWRSIPSLAKEGFPIFKMLGIWSGREDALAAEIAAREARAKSAADVPHPKAETAA